VGKLLTLLAVFAAGYLWGDVALSLAIEVWQDIIGYAKPKLEEVKF